MTPDHAGSQSSYEVSARFRSRERVRPSRLPRPEISGEENDAAGRLPQGVGFLLIFLLSFLFWLSLGLFLL